MNSIKNTVVNHFNFLANYYDEKCLNRKAYLQSIDDLILAYLQKKHSKPLKILDVGCGTGKRTEKYKLSLEESVVYGCDISPIMIDIAQKRNIDKAILSDMAHLPFSQESFDVILCLFNSFGYVPDQQKRLQVLTQFSKILKNNGLLFIDVMNKWHMGEGLNYKKSIYSILRTYITSAFSSSMYGTMLLSALMRTF
ncbi:class I SAM-dependent methyltransferase [Roseofilum sp. BLCC_M154]|uniref:Class I SAM-dependent methyltransferase n=1 Tax=Roseofilum acuticapitatum BLCC-M154 TaxID=3022444 RepID=A0ABT7AX33_9CYAN|nr:class I SAM-dependent methyltransferase [Roseofilum acuticapitatum]MDJ1171462.1 class I SAM-dependent methyltransferase [Roseofilum acuticapitatum BLCC-M154]